jgi:hypothetical protein
MAEVKALHSPGFWTMPSKPLGSSRRLSALSAVKSNRTLSTRRKKTAESEALGGDVIRLIPALTGSRS